MLDWLKQILKQIRKEEDLIDRESDLSSFPGMISETLTVEPIDVSRLYDFQPAELNGHFHDESLAAQVYLEKIKQKIETLVERFADGDLNRRQFENLHHHYLREMELTERIIDEGVAPQDWKRQHAEGQTMLIRRLNAARLLGFTIYATKTYTPLARKGDFPLGTRAAIQLLDSSLAVKPSTTDDGIVFSDSFQDYWCCIIQGNFTATILILSEEPSRKQTQTLLEMQSVFENANGKTLEIEPVPAHLLAIPHNFFVGKEL